MNLTTIVDRLGGRLPLAKALGRPRSLVLEWIALDRVPLVEDRWALLIHARNHGVALRCVDLWEPDEIGWTGEDYRRLALAGFTRLDTARILGVSPQSCDAAAKKAQPTFRFPRAPKISQARGSHVEEQILKLHAEKRSTTEIARIVARTPETVLKHLAAHNLAPNTPYPETLKLVEKLQALAARDLSVTQAAKIVGKSPGHVSVLKARYDIPFKDGRPANSGRKPDPKLARARAKAAREKGGREKGGREKVGPPKAAPEGAPEERAHA